MRTLIATVAASLVTAAAAAAMTFHSAPEAKVRPQGEPATQAVAGLTWQSGKAVLRLTDKPCPFEELSAELGMEGISPARAYEVQVGGKKSIGCWSTDAGGDVVTLEPGREIGTIPLDWFRTSGA